MGTQQKASTATSSRRFNLIFFSVLGLTIGCLLIAIGISIFGSEPLTPPEQRIFDIGLSFFMLGAGAIVGLLGKRTLGDGDKITDTK